MRAMEICRETQGECNWPQIPEECWQRAVAELFDTSINKDVHTL